MALYLILEYHMSGPEGANVLFLWAAISNFLPIIGAFISDSFLGRFLVIALGTLTSLLVSQFISFNSHLHFNVIIDVCIYIYIINQSDFPSHRA